MMSLNDFLKKKEASNHLTEIGMSAAAISYSVMSTGLINRKSKADEFASQVTTLASSNDVISELSEEIGQPGEFESEAEFVNRAKGVFKTILMNRLNAKT